MRRIKLLLLRLVYALLAGTWSDIHGRKGLIFLAVLGQILASLSYALNYLLLHQLPWQFLYLELLNDVCGTYVSYYLAVYSFIAYITTPTKRFSSFQAVGVQIIKIYTNVHGKFDIFKLIQFSRSWNKSNSFLLWKQ